ncbi:hypothetical protein [Vibrio diabolicus]|uniref:hypothetical protein n=1 Tax=Vibrio diabolicus TaxID=50719 RepID=UPI002E9A2F92|nr:hypothetical protein [Vibrio alginolyticus]
MRLEFLLILGGLAGLVINGFRYLALRRIDENSDDLIEHLKEYNWTMLLMSIVFLPTGLYLVFSDDSAWYNTVGVLISVYGISALVQSFRPYDTAQEIERFGRDPESLGSTLIISRLIGLVAILFGGFLFQL